MEWPRAYVRQLWKSCSNIQDFITVKKEFLQRLRDSFFGASFVDYVDASTHYISPFNHICNNVSTHRQKPALWLPISYHPLLVRNGGLVSALKAVHKDPFLEDLLAALFGGGKPYVQVAWKASAMPFINTLVQW